MMSKRRLRDKDVGIPSNVLLVFEKDRSPHSEPCRHSYTDVTWVLRNNVVHAREYPVSRRVRTAFRARGGKSSQSSYHGFRLRPVGRVLSITSITPPPPRASSASPPAVAAPGP